MDSKRTYKKLSTWFWWILTALPLIIFIGIFFSYVINLKSGDVKFTASEMLSYWNYISTLDIMETDIIYFMNEMIPEDLYNAIFSLLNNLNIGSRTYLTILLSWGIAIQFYHVIFDIMVWLPHKMHDVMER